MALDDAFRGRNIPLEEFPSLLQMEGHTGFSGVLFSAVWFAAAAYYFPSIRGLDLLWWLAAAIVIAFFALGWISFPLAGVYFKKINQPNREDYEIQVRKVITSLSFSYVVVCCVLVWLTGGVASPFTVFYVMIFTLTIARCKFPHPAWVVFIYFFGAIAFTVFAYQIWPSPIPHVEMAKIIESEFHKNMHIIFLFASLIVPTVSHYFVTKKERARLAQAPSRPATQMY